MKTDITTLLDHLITIGVTEEGAAIVKDAIEEIDRLRSKIIGLHAEAGDAANTIAQMASGNRSAAFEIRALRARVSELEKEKANV